MAVGKDEYIYILKSKFEDFDSVVADFNDVVLVNKSHSSFKNYQINRKEYLSFINNRQFDKALFVLSEIIDTYSILIKKMEIDFEEEEKIKAENLLQLGIDLHDSIDRFINGPVGESSIEARSVNKLMQEVKNTQEKHEKYAQNFQKVLNHNIEEIVEIRNRAQDMKDFVEEKLDETNKYYDETIARLIEKEKALDKLLGIVSGKKIAGKYEESAGDERTMANWLRWGSIGCMVLLVIVVGYSFWETTRESFKWENSIFRVVLAFFLSVPAAYLAKESAKHREQQYSHLQTSLDLNAIDPFIASLPKEEQDKIKTDIAGKIFVSKDYSKVSQDAYPINTHELLIELLKKLDLSSTKPSLPTTDNSNTPKSS